MDNNFFKWSDLIHQNQAIYSKFNEIRNEFPLVRDENSQYTITIKQANFDVDIWECGLFRQATVNFLVDAKINGKQGDASISMTYKFYYDDDSCDIGKYILRDGWEEYLTAENKAILAESRKKYQEQ